MIDRLGRLFDGTPAERGTLVVQWAALALLALVFLAVSTTIVAYDGLLGARNNISALEVGDITPQDIRAPFDWRYESQVLTDRRRETAMESTLPVFDPPDPEVARQQVQLARQILDYIDNVRRDPFGTQEQKIKDISQVTALTLERDVIEYILSLNDDQWRSLDTEIITVLERMMRQEIREANLPVLRGQLPMQV